MRSQKHYIQDIGSQLITLFESGTTPENAVRILEEQEKVLVVYSSNTSDSEALSNELREKKISMLVSLGIPLAVIIHPTAVISPLSRIAKGCTIHPYAVINAYASIGTGCIINTQADIEHDCVVEDFVNVCPKVSMAGHTVVGRKTFLGIGCTIIDGIRIGTEATVGAGAVVIRDVPDHAAVAGVPAKNIRKI